MCLPTLTVSLSLVSPFLFIAMSAQRLARVLDLQVVGGDGTNGYIEATVLYSNGSTATGPICGTVNLITANFACYSRGFLASNEQGTVDSIG